MSKLSIFQIILLITFGVLGIIGVLIFAFANTGGSTTSIGPVVIWGNLDSKIVSAVLQQATDNNQDLAQVSYVQKDSATYEADLLNAIADGTGPDLFIVRQDYLIRNAARIIPIPTASLSPSQFKTLFIDVAGVFANSQGAFGIPIAVDPLVLFWNKDALSAAGYAKPPATWPEVESMAIALQKRGELGEIVNSAIALGEYANVTNAKEILSALIFQAGGEVVGQDVNGKLVPGLLSGGTGGSQTAESALGFYTEFANPSKSHYSWNRSLPESQKAFAEGVTAMYLGFASEGRIIASMNPNLNFDVAALPQIANATRVVGTARVYGMSISRNARNPQGALAAALQFATPATGMDKNLSTALGIPSALRDVLALPAPGASDLYRRAALISRSWYDPDPTKTSDIFRAMIENITSGTLSLSDAVQRANAALGQLLGA